MFLAVLRVAGSLQRSTEVMKAMQNLIKVPEIQATMRDLSKEMMKVGRDYQHKSIQFLYSQVITRNGTLQLIPNATYHYFFLKKKKKKLLNLGIMYTYSSFRLA